MTVDQLIDLLADIRYVRGSTAEAHQMGTSSGVFGLSTDSNGFVGALALADEPAEEHTRFP